jgi:hypothetical protein
LGASEVASREGKQSAFGAENKNTPQTNRDKVEHHELEKITLRHDTNNRKLYFIAAKILTVVEEVLFRDIDGQSNFFGSRSNQKRITIFALPIWSSDIEIVHFGPSTEEF